jgi:DNA polymerase III alpha subunit
MCKSLGLKPDEYNEFGKEVGELNDKHEGFDARLNKLYENPEYGKILKDSEIFIDVIDSISIHPCAVLLATQNIKEILGVTKAKDHFVCNIDSNTSDKWKFLKNDYLEVDVWRILKKTYDYLNLPVDDPEELIKKIDEKTWKLYDDGITESLNQTSTDFARSIVRTYKPRSYAELCAFVAAIRPGFASLLPKFIHREPYTNGIQELDELLSSTNHYLLYQESIMKFLIWLGIPEDETYGIIKKIAKKSFKEDELNSLKEILLCNMHKKNIDKHLFEKIWKVVEDNADYSFNAAHALCVAYDSLYSAYLKSHYFLEYLTICFNEYENKQDKTAVLSSELKYFGVTLKPIKFGYSASKYRPDKTTNTIYKGLASIKYMNESVSEYLFSLDPCTYTNFIDVLTEFESNKNINSRQIAILIKLDYFDVYGPSKSLLKIKDVFDMLYDAKTLSTKKITDKNLNVSIIQRNAILSPTGKTYTKINNINLLNEYEEYILSTKEYFSVNEKIDFQEEYLGYINISTNKPEDRFKLYIKDVDVKFSRKNNRPWAYLIKGYSIGSGKEAELMIKAEYFQNNTIHKKDIIVTDKYYIQRKVTAKYDNYWLNQYTILNKAI